jgi:protein-L-isoaspartate O-methyltransferase
MPRSADDARAPGASVSREHFDGLYEGSDDPWKVSSAWYERRKYAITIAALPRERYQNALEPGCSIGGLTRLLAARCERIVAFDFAEAAVALAREALRGVPNVVVELRALSQGVPQGRFDLIVASEILYYLSQPELETVADRMISGLADGGDLVAVHHRARDHCRGYDGHNVHALLSARPELREFARYDDDDFALLALRKQPPQGSGVSAGSNPEAGSGSAGS